MSIFLSDGSAEPEARPPPLLLPPPLPPFSPAMCACMAPLSASCCAGASATSPERNICGACWAVCTIERMIKGLSTAPLAPLPRHASHTGSSSPNRGAAEDPNRNWSLLLPGACVGPQPCLWALLSAPEKCKSSTLMASALRGSSASWPAPSKSTARHTEDTRPHSTCAGTATTAGACAVASACVFGFQGCCAWCRNAACTTCRMV
mmetsp:Transcript_49776/g.100173  ORF Transcript_49776/g.100173 Transcript_49776/m.100173 type:complete len:206 (-) Transcript_49776:658-1275(-)